MRTNKQRTRIDYAPMVPSCSVSIGGSLTQSYSADDSQYVPDRAVTPLVITPIVTVVAADGTVGTTDSDGKVWPVNGNARLGQIKWLLNGTDITTLPDWIGQYEIDNTTAATRGAIVIRRNIPQGQRMELRFEGIIADSRTGGNVKVVSEPVILTTADSAEDQYLLSLDRGDSVAYDPFRDSLALYDHEVGNGLAVEDASLRAQATDSECYLRDIPVSLYRGLKQVAASDFIIKVLRKDAGGLTELVPGSDCELLSAAAGVIRLDLRLIESGEYMVEAYTQRTVDGNTVTKLRAQSQFSVYRPYRAMQVEVLNSTAINPADRERRVSASVTRRGQSVRYPARLMRLQWMSDTAALTEVKHNLGERGYISLDRAGFFAAASDGTLDVYCDFETKGAHAIATDSQGSVYADRNGNQYIMTTV